MCPLTPYRGNSKGGDVDPTAREAFTRVVTDALQEPEGQTQIETVKGMLYRALEKNALIPNEQRSFFGWQ
jgi:hypothetical protein